MADYSNQQQQLKEKHCCVTSGIWLSRSTSRSTSLSWPLILPRGACHLLPFGPRLGGSGFTMEAPRM